jgi:hypothetical protein
MPKEGSLYVRLNVNSGIQGRHATMIIMDDIEEAPKHDPEFSFNLREPDPKPDPELLWPMDLSPNEARQLMQAFSRGALRSDEFKNLYEQVPRMSNDRRYDWSR